MELSPATIQLITAMPTMAVLLIVWYQLRDGKREAHEDSKAQTEQLLSMNRKLARIEARQEDRTPEFSAQTPPMGVPIVKQRRKTVSDDAPSIPRVLTDEDVGSGR